jgi:4-hydroxybenzoate polyprenyltransferase
MSQFTYWIRLSRPRFWLYLAGTFLVGVAVATQEYSSFLRYDVWLYFLFFLLPANFFLYGINDYFDQETDSINPKKHDKEIVVSGSTQRSQLVKMFAVLGILFAAALVVQQNIYAQVVLLIFFLLSFFYSAPPFRFKARPFLDFISNVLYILPGVFGYIYITSYLPNILDICMLALWAWAMHLFSAIPDIKPDKQAGIQTTAVVLGKKHALLLCAFFWALFSILLWIRHPDMLPLGGVVVVYPILPLLLIIKKDLSIERVYWLFPYINAAIGFAAYLFFIL